MTDSPQRQGSGPGDQQPYGYSGYTDPAYANQTPYGPSYAPQAPPDPTRQLPPYSPYGYDAYATGSYGPPLSPGGAPPEPPPSDGPPRRWLWVLAGVSVLTVLGLVIALVVVGSNSQQTVVAPPTDLEPTFTTPSAPPTTSRTRPPTTTPSRPRVPAPVPSVPGPGESTVPGEPETVVYDVGGTGRAISITYVDTGGVLQMEFNVMLPWTKEVELQSAASSASVTVANFGPEVTCSITVGGEQVEQQTGSLLTTCGAMG